MPRQKRQKSKTGIYHVMVRGINKQFIFHDEQDLVKMESIIRRISTDDTAELSSKKSCAIYAYCLMGNHLHLLIEEQGCDISVIMKRIGVTYVSYYNKRYNRVGPLFQGRFNSEPVDSFEYFVTLLNYIHTNPVAAKLVNKPGDYKWSSYSEYESVALDNSSRICSVVKAFGEMEWNHLREIVLNPDEPVQSVLDHESMTDNEAKELMKYLCHPLAQIHDLVNLPKTERNEIIERALQAGVGVRQIARITGIGRMVIARLSKKMAKKA